ncbi:hypothetical protein AB1Y20_001887 [Prymnesium parvum]|uniref:Uncharacterized protein n=1 Tax=Prymnesium parvum TaxID=97485 RepID=A0AB34J9I8_PRYPA
MVLAVPPPLEGLGPRVAASARSALAAWQSELWDAVQGLRAKPELPPAHPRWMGTVAQLSQVIGGSVVLGGDDEAPDVVPLSTAATPTVKASPAGPLVRLEGPPGQSGRYASLSVLMDSSVGIWPAVISVGDGGGVNAKQLRGKDDRLVEAQVVTHHGSRLAFRLVDTATREVISWA